LWSFVIFFPIWYVWTKKNLATLLVTRTTIPCKKKLTKLRSCFIHEQKSLQVGSLFVKKIRRIGQNGIGYELGTTHKNYSQKVLKSRSKFFTFFTERVLSLPQWSSVTSEVD
jgi:hypothetical protein